MPRIPPEPKSTRIHQLTRESIRYVNSPLLAYSQCESAHFLRTSISHAIRKDLVPVAEGVELIPTENLISICKSDLFMPDSIKAITGEEDINQAAIIAAASLSNASVLFRQANNVTEQVCPILYYYGVLSFFDFITRIIVRRQRVGGGGHGIRVTCNSDGWDFDKAWPRNSCHVHFEATGDFPFIVDALTLGGWPSLFSRFRLHQDTKRAPWQVVKNSSSLFTLNKMSLDILCNFDRDKYLRESPDLKEWLHGTDARIMIWKMTSLLMDYLIVFIASNLARYYIPAWQAIIEAQKSSVYNDIRNAYTSVSEELPYYFEDEHPFQYSFRTRIP